MAQEDKSNVQAIADKPIHNNSCQKQQNFSIITTNHNNSKKTNNFRNSSSDPEINKKINYQNFDTKHKVKTKALRAMNKTIRDIYFREQIFEKAREIRESRKPKTEECDSSHIHNTFFNSIHNNDDEDQKGYKRQKQKKNKVTTVFADSINEKEIMKKTESNNNTQKDSSKLSLAKHQSNLKSASIKRSTLFEKKSLISKDDVKSNNTKLKKSQCIMDKNSFNFLSALKVGHAIMTKVVTRNEPKFIQEKVNTDAIRRKTPPHDDRKIIALFNNLDNLKNYNIIDHFSESEISQNQEILQNITSNQAELHNLRNKIDEVYNKFYKSNPNYNKLLQLSYNRHISEKEKAPLLGCKIQQYMENGADDDTMLNNKAIQNQKDKVYINEISDYFKKQKTCKNKVMYSTKRKKQLEKLNPNKINEQNALEYYIHEHFLNHYVKQKSVVTLHVPRKSQELSANFLNTLKRSRTQSRNKNVSELSDGQLEKSVTIKNILADVEPLKPTKNLMANHIQNKFNASRREIEKSNEPKKKIMEDIPKPPNVIKISKKNYLKVMQEQFPEDFDKPKEDSLDIADLFVGKDHINLYETNIVTKAIKENALTFAVDNIDTFSKVHKNIVYNEDIKKYAIGENMSKNSEQYWKCMLFHDHFANEKPIFKKEKINNYKINSNKKEGSGIDTTYSHFLNKKLKKSLFQKAQSSRDFRNDSLIEKTDKKNTNLKTNTTYFTTQDSLQNTKNDTTRNSNFHNIKLNATNNGNLCDKSLKSEQVLFKKGQRKSYLIEGNFENPHNRSICTQSDESDHNIYKLEINDEEQKAIEDPKKRIKQSQRFFKSQMHPLGINNGDKLLSYLNNKSSLNNRQYINLSHAKDKFFTQTLEDTRSVYDLHHFRKGFDNDKISEKYLLGRQIREKAATQRGEIENEAGIKYKNSTSHMLDNSDNDLKSEKTTRAIKFDTTNKKFTKKNQIEKQYFLDKSNCSKNTLTKEILNLNPKLQKSYHYDSNSLRRPCLSSENHSQNDSEQNLSKLTKKFLGKYKKLDENAQTSYQQMKNDSKLFLNYFQDLQTDVEKAASRFISNEDYIDKKMESKDFVTKI